MPREVVADAAPTPASTTTQAGATTPEGSSVEVRHFGNLAMGACAGPGKPLKIQIDRSNLFLHSGSVDEEHFRILLPVWVVGGRLLLTAHNDKRSLGLVVDRQGNAELYLDHEKQNLQLKCEVTDL